MPKHSLETAQKIKYAKSMLGRMVRVTVHSRQHVGVVKSLSGEYLQLVEPPTEVGGVARTRSIYLGHVSEILPEPLEGQSGR